MRVRAQGGFTVLEALIAAILFFLAISIAVMSFMAGSQNFTSSQDSIKACHNCVNILRLITNEIVQADPSTIVISAGGTSISFSKYHNPSNEVQAVTWSLTGNMVERDYTGTSSGTHSTSFGDNIQSLNFLQSTNAYNYKKVRVSIVICSNTQLPGGGRKIYELFEDAYPRMDQTVDACVKFN